MLSVSIDTITANIGSTANFNADTWAVVPTNTVILNGNLRWLGDANTATFVVINVITPDEQTLTSGKMDPMSCIVEDCVIINAREIFIWSRTW